MKRIPRRVAACVALLLLAAVAVPAQAAASSAVAPGLSYEVHAAPGSGAVHVARRDSTSPVRLQLVQARDAATGGLETTASMCRRTRGCQLAVNGDFFTADGPVGAVVVDGRMVRSPRSDHEQLSLDPLRSTERGLGDGGWSGVVARVDGSEPLPLDGVNVALPAGGLVLYTSQHGAATPTCTCVEVRLREENGPAARLGQPTTATVVGRDDGDSPLGAGVAVLAAEGAAAERLAAVAAAGRLTLLVSVAQPTRHNVGVHPVVLREGQPLPYDAADPMLADPHPRTLVGWDAAGTVWLVVADGRRGAGPGLTGQQALDLLRRLGATEGAMLDGGGSSTFVRRGEVVNAPSDGRERPVANALVLVWDSPKAAVRQAPVVAEQVAAPVPVAAPPSARPGVPAPPPAAPAPAPVVVTAPALAVAPTPAPPSPPPPAAVRRPPQELPDVVVTAPPPEVVVPASPVPVLPAAVAGVLLAAVLGCWVRAIVM